MSRIPGAEQGALPTGIGRLFAMTSLSAGFAAAAGGDGAQPAVTTDTAGLVAGEVGIPVHDGELPAYRAAPAARPDAPVILVVQEIFGVHEHIKDVCRRFAKLGYVAIAPELYARQGDASAYDDVPTLLSELVSKVPDEQVMADLDACVRWAEQQGADTSRLGITGFCWGGRITWLYAAHNPALKAGVAWYGKLKGATTALQPRYPIDLVSELKAPVLGLYGGQDSGIPLDSVDAFKSALSQGSAAAQASEMVVYPDAPHAFHADYRPSYRPDEAQDGWQRTLDWFATHLG